LIIKSQRYSAMLIKRVKLIKICLQACRGEDEVEVTRVKSISDSGLPSGQSMSTRWTFDVQYEESKNAKKVLAAL
jgi:hypothetical protein